jgi:hypothetical protein
MKKTATIMFVFILAAGFLVAGGTRAEAMDHDPSAVLAGAAIILGIPVLHAIAHEAMYPGYAYVPASHEYRRHVYAAPVYIERTKIVYAQPMHRRPHTHWGRTHSRWPRGEWRTYDRWEGRGDARGGFRR